VVVVLQTISAVETRIQRRGAHYLMEFVVEVDIAKTVSIAMTVKTVVQTIQTTATKIRE
jgi:hypothetical protein